MTAKGAGPSLPSPWVAATTDSGATTWRWPSGPPIPRTLQLAETTPASAAAFVQFESASPETQELPVGIERNLYRVTRTDKSTYSLEPLSDWAALSTDELYLDDITITPSGRALRYAVLEAALPPGASVESTTWGVNFPDDEGEGKLEGLERARHEPTRFGYAVPVDGITEPVHVRHLIRFAQKGKYNVPRARLYRMYLPAAKAFENGEGPLEVEVE